MRKQLKNVLQLNFYISRMAYSKIFVSGFASSFLGPEKGENVCLKCDCTMWVCDKAPSMRQKSIFGCFVLIFPSFSSTPPKKKVEKWIIFLTLNKINLKMPAQWRTHNTRCFLLLFWLLFACQCLLKLSMLNGFSRDARASGGWKNDSAPRAVPYVQRFTSGDQSISECSISRPGKAFPLTSTTEALRTFPPYHPTAI